jgi:hypothetical protein
LSSQSIPLRSRGLALDAHSAYYHVIDSRTQPEGCVLQTGEARERDGSTMRPWRWGGVVLMALALGACSSGGTAKLSSKSLCENSGGRYAQGVCQPGTARKAADMCQGFGGLYLVNEDLCHIPTP